MNGIYLNSQLNSYADAVYMYRAAVVDWRPRLLWELADCSCRLTGEGMLEKPQ